MQMKVKLLESTSVTTVHAFYFICFESGSHKSDWHANPRVSDLALNASLLKSLLDVYVTGHQYHS